MKLVAKNPYFLFTLIAILVSFGWWLNFSIWQINWLFLVLTIIYFFINAVFAGEVLSKIIYLESAIKPWLGLFFLLFLLSFGAAIPIFFYKILPIYLLFILLFLTITLSTLNRWLPSRANNKALPWQEEKNLYNIHAFWGIILIILFLLALFFLIKSRTGSFILSPWESIRPYYLYLWALITLLVGFFIFSKTKTRILLLIIILLSLLLHSYLPIVYKTGFGGDKWRHLGAERSLMNGQQYLPVLIGDNVSMKKIGPWQIPEVLIVGNKNSYVNMWGLTIALAWLFKIDVFWVDLLLGYLLYSIFFPLLLFKLGQLFIRKRSILLLFVLLPICFSPFQMYGSITVPNSFGFLWFLFCLWLVVYALKNGFTKSLGWAIILGFILSYFNYVLYLILLFEVLFLAIFLRAYSRSCKKWAKILWLFLLIIFLLICLFIIPLADLVSNNHFQSLGTAGSGLLIQIGNFLKRIFLSEPMFPRAFNMEQDNWLFAQINQNLSRANFLKLFYWSWLLAPLTCLIILWGILRRPLKENFCLKFLFILLLFIILINQFISIYLMSGNHIFNKRLVLITALLLMIFLVIGLQSWLELKWFSGQGKQVTLIIFLALLSTTVYASGPKMQTVTSDELSAAQYLWQKIKDNSTNNNYCVLANTWPLLALESESARQVITGGFPSYFEYAQPERVQLFDNMNKNPSIKDINRAVQITGAKDCYFMTEERWIYIYRKNTILKKLNNILGVPERLGDIYLWHYQPNK